MMDYRYQNSSRVWSGTQENRWLGKLISNNKGSDSICLVENSYLCIYIVNLPLAVLYISLSYEIVSVEFLDSCLVLRFSYQVILVEHI